MFGVKIRFTLTLLTLEILCYGIVAKRSSSLPTWSYES